MITQNEIALKILNMGKDGYKNDAEGFEKLNQANALIEKHVQEQLILSGVSHRREQLAISCLNNIVEPINYLRKLAEVDGGKLDGIFAIHLTKQGMFYQELAIKALKEIDNCG